MPTLHWLTRDEDLRTASRVPYRLLEEAPDLSAGEPDTGNLLIQGDNLEALKALLPFYAGRIKCIYIDPPYNTRSAFEHYDDSLEHTQWLAMIWPRLELLRDLLAAHVWFSETGRPWNGNGDSPFLGLYDGHAYALLYNGILGDKHPNGGNVLTRATLAAIREEIEREHVRFDGPLTVYGEQSRLASATLERTGITFKQMPYEVKART